MPLPAADMGDTMKKLSETISSLYMYLTSGYQPKSNQFCQNCKQYSHFTSYCKQNCNHCEEEGHPFIYCPNLCAPESKASTSKSKPPKTKSSKPKNTPGKTKGSEPLKSELVNYESPAAGYQPQQQDQHDVSQQAYVAEPYGVPLEEEDGTFNEAPTIEVQKSSSLKTSSQKPQQAKKSKPKPAVPLLAVNPPNFNVLKTLADTHVPISLYNLAEIAPSVRAQMIQYLVKEHPEFTVKKRTPYGHHPRWGSTSNIISESFLRLLGVQEYSQVKEKFTFANSKTEECLGFVKYLTVDICGVRKLISAAIFQLTWYNLLIGLHALSEFGISVSFWNHEWFIQRENTLFPIDMCYTSPHNERESFLTAVEAINQNKGLTTKQRKKLHTFMKQYQDLFRNEDDPLTPANLENHVIDTENHFPVL
ncbi:hypothetical protein DSO57_1002430 [Entomophthora muscae]|uniref:Uncharacterized protein n=1 Tax=Entomophthora muscae TaxID=34485 RepID=A0ACC2SAR2_9FUNG|nr:hypothetical protein DSO57_1002430 [Entomophthora muscae]